MSISNISRMGEIFAILDEVSRRRGASPLTLDMVITAPLARFGEYMRKLEPHKFPDLDSNLAELVNDMETLPTRALTNDEQGEFFLGFYRRKSRLGGATEEGSKAGRPPAEEARDWSGVDWSKTDAEIGREMGVARQTVLWHRKRENPR